MIKPIEISKEQKDTIIFLARTYYPEYAKGDRNIDNIIMSVDNGVRIYFQDTDGRMRLITIPWFEFCYTWLAEKIFNPNPKAPDRNLKSNFLNFYWSVSVWWSETYIDKLEAAKEDVSHPIDYLYTCHLKLKECSE